MGEELNEFSSEYPTLSEMSNSEFYKGTLGYHSREVSQDVSRVWDSVVVHPVLWLILHIILLLMPIIEFLSKSTEDES